MIAHGGKGTSQMKYELIRFDTREEALEYSSRFIAGGLATAVEDRGRASLMVSGGRSPGPLFDQLSSTDLPWAQVTVGLVDERWVPLADDFSNESLIRIHLLKAKAGAAGLIPMKTEASTPHEAVEDRNAAYAPHCAPVDVIVLGMGGDGHTASWFEGTGSGHRARPRRNNCSS